jgi:hypothetical protein
MQLFNPDDPSVMHARQFEPVAYVREGLSAYNKEHGFPDIQEPSHTLQNNHKRGHAQYLAYRDALAAPGDTPGAKESYDAATEHIKRQYEFMVRPQEQGGLGITHEVTTDDPYPDAASMAEDVRNNRRIRTYATASTNVGGEQAPTLQAFDNDTNDKLRAVHDVFGHASMGRGFTRHGEEAAYQMHRQTFPPEAQAAMASELRGQNSFLNYGPDSEFPDVGSRMITMPDWASDTGPLPKPKSSKKKPQGTQLDLGI